MANFCPKCGKAAIEQARFCGACGSPISTPPQNVPQSASSTVFPQSGITVERVLPDNSVDKVLPNSAEHENHQPLNDGSLSELLDPNAIPVIKKKSKKKWWIITVSLILVITVAAGAILVPHLLRGDSSDGEKTSLVSDPDSLVDPAQVTRTIMIYIVGSDLESRYGAATDDISEMVDAEYDLSKVNVLLCAGGANDWQNETIDSRETSYFLVTQDDVIEVSANTQTNMGSANTLSAFLNYGVASYPAQRYGLILWDHGGGPMMGYGQDELSYDSLQLSELSSALKNSPFNTGNKLEFLGFDACLMGSVETAWIFKDYAKYFIASQEVEPGQGWDYGFLSQLSQCRTGGEIGKVIIDSYFDYYQQLYATSPSQESEITLSCLDLTKIQAVEQGLDQLFTNVNKDVISGQLATVSRCRYSSKAFGKYASETGYDLIDLKHMATLLSTSYPQASALITALTDLVVYTRANVSNANGVSIYHPYDIMEQARQWINTFNTFGFASQYADYLENFVTNSSNNTISLGYYKNFSKTAGSVTANGQQYDLSLQLTKDQMDTFSAAEYYVFWEMPAEATFSKSVEYLQVFSGQDVVLSTEGKLSATYGGKAVYGKNHETGRYSDCPLSMYQIYDGTLEEKYYFPCMFWDLSDGLNMDLLPVNWLMKIKNGVPTLLNAYDMVADEENTFPDKYLINSADYDLYTFANNSYTVANDTNGNIQFTMTGSSYGFEYERDKGFSLELRPIPDKSQYRAVFLIEDIYGNRYFSQWIPLA